MSAEADAAAWRAKTRTAGEKVTLLRLANRADERGECTDEGIEEIAEATGLTPRGVGEQISKLSKSGLLEKVSGGGRGNKTVYRLILPGLETRNNADVGRLDTGNSADADRKNSGNRADALPADRSVYESVESTTSINQSVSARETEFVQELRDAEIPDQLLADGKALLREKRKVDGKLVTPREMAVAVVGLAAFNAALSRDFGVGANMKSIVMRSRDRPSWTPAEHARLVKIACEDPWWERTGNGRRPSPNVIWGDRSFENVVQDAADRKAGKGKKTYRGRTR